MPSIPQNNRQRTPAELDAAAIQAADLMLDADQGIAVMNALSLKWYEQGFIAYQLGIERPHFWTRDHERGYTAAAAGYQMPLFVTTPAGTPATYRSA